MLRRGSLPVRGAWIEMVIVRFSRDSVSSLPVRGAWIEITTGGVQMDKNTVAPRAGSVD